MPKASSRKEKVISPGKYVKFDVRDIADEDFGGDDFGLVKQYDEPRNVTGTVLTVPARGKRDTEDAVVLLSRSARK